MRAQTITSTIHGYPRIGPHRELKTALEAYWSGGDIRGAGALLAAASELRKDTWRELTAAGLDLVPVNGFSLYDHVLDTAVLVDAVPERYRIPHLGELDRYFALARGHQSGGTDLAALEMTKWFDTNYHYIVPELSPDTTFAVAGTKPFDELAELKSLRVPARGKVVLLGPVSFLLLAKHAPDGPDFDRLKLLDALLETYAAILERLRRHGADWVQLGEPAFAADRTPRELDALARAYETLGREHHSRLLVSTYFDRAGDALNVLLDAPIDGIGLDRCRGIRDLDALETRGGAGTKAIAAGVVDGRNIWANDLDTSLDTLRRAAELTPELLVSSSCSLLHVPITTTAEPALDPEILGWLAFAREKVAEVVLLTTGLRDGDDAIAGELDRSRQRREQRAASPRVLNATVRERLAALAPKDFVRSEPADERARRQRARLGLPALPTTTIGSFPQTAELRRARRDLDRGRIDNERYEDVVRTEIDKVIALQEDIGLDVIVHGEPERNDMVQYFGEQLDGYAFTKNGWVQSYGSRCTRPPIIYGDVTRPTPMTTRWTAYAKTRTPRVVKGMLTGPVTMLQWSFARDDQPDADTCRQIALAIRDEVADLDSADVAVIQVDEPAIREGLPLRRDGWAVYLDWAVSAFRLATAVARPETQVHTHMCYSEFGDIVDAIGALDADVVSIEAARSGMDLLTDLTGISTQVGPGVFDIHSPRVPSVDEMVELIQRAVAVLGAERVWVNPDCGLKTRGYAEVEAALRNLVAAARRAR